MANYIVLDLEWNQSASGKAGAVPGLPFEIIEIGAVKLNDKFEIVSEFSRIIKPVVYKKLHFRVLEVVHTSVAELRNNGEDFLLVAHDFIEWCHADETSSANAAGTVGNEQVIFCTWGEADLMQLQRNMKYFGVENPFPKPLLYYDVQKLYALITEGKKTAIVPLDRAADELGIKECGEFHRAIDDARYTAKVLQKIDFDSVKSYVSLDYFRIPENKEEEIYLIFPDYSKYVSRDFANKEDMVHDTTVSELVCNRCNRRLKKKLRWFSSNQHLYYCLGTCPEHGYVKGKIRAKHTSDGKKYFAVKTTKLCTADEAKQLETKKQNIKEHRAMKRRQK